jgi:protocatechuate 3,4-dioxygenase beta subunit
MQARIPDVDAQGWPPDRADAGLDLRSHRVDIAGPVDCALEEIMDDLTGAPADSGTSGAVAAPSVSAERLAELVGAVRTALADVIERHGVTEDEWYPALEFLGDVARADELILLSDTMRLSILVNDLTHRPDPGATAASVLGPFWRPAPEIGNPGTLFADDEPGERLVVTGIVRGADGAPVAGAALDVWQCNASGVYDVQVDELAGATRWRGVLRTGSDGRYELRTIVPPPYEVKTDGPVGALLARLGRHAYRPAHIHLKATAPGHEPLTTMVFFAGDEWLGNDTIGADRPELTVPIERNGGAPATVTFEVTLRPVA